MIANEVDSVFREHVRIGDTWKVYSANDDLDDWEQQGDEPSLLMQEIVGCDVHLADVLIEALSNDEWHVIQDGGDPFYDKGTNYVYAPDGVHEHHWLWREFQDGVKYSGRFLDPQVLGQLQELLADFPDEWMSHADGPVREYAPDSVVIFRARSARTEKEASQILCKASTALSAPPRDRRSAGRLNAEGIGVFYGGFSEEVCIAEMRPSLASYVVVGRFELLRPIKVLDLTAFDRHRPTGSLFRPGFSEERLRWRFLQSFHSSITQPVQPGTESMEYVPTQVVAEYLRTALGYDGVVYRSAQVGVTYPDDPEEDPFPTPLELRNLALFNSEGLVETRTGASNGETATERPLAGAGILRFDGDPIHSSSFRPEPAHHVLRYQAGSAVCHRIKRISYAWEREYLTPPCDSMSQDSDADF